MSSILSPKQENVELYLPLSEGSGTTAYDYSDNSNNGTINGATYDKIPDGGYALSFDGSDDYLVQNSSVNYGSKNITMGVWVKYTNNSDVMMIWNEVSADSDSIIRCYLNNSGDLQVLNRNSVNRLDGYTTNSNLYDGKMHLIIMTLNFSEQEIKIYIDGVSQTVTYQNRVGTVSFDNLKLYYGGDYDNSRRYFDGQVRMPFIYSELKSKDWIKKFYQETFIQ